MDVPLPEALLRLDLNSLIGLTVTEARTRVEAAGGRLQAVTNGQAIGLPYIPSLVTVVHRDDRVTSVLGLLGRPPGPAWFYPITFIFG